MMVAEQGSIVRRSNDAICTSVDGNIATIPDINDSTPIRGLQDGIGLKLDRNRISAGARTLHRHVVIQAGRRVERTTEMDSGARADLARTGPPVSGIVKPS